MTENFDKLIALVENKQLTEEEIIQQMKPILDLDPNLVKERKHHNCNLTILHYAAFHDNIKVIQYLLDYGADPMAQDSNGNMSIHFAAGPYMTNAYEASSWEAVEIFLKHGVDINVKGWGDLTPLHAAAARGKIEIVKNLIASEADIHAKSKMGEIPLHCAASSSSWETIEAFLDAGVDINATTNSGETALHYAAETGNLEIVNKLIEHGADVSIRSSDGYTLLHAAAQGQNLEIVEKFFNPIDINIEDSRGYTPILYAWEKGQNNSYEIVKFLLNNGVSIVPKNWKVNLYEDYKKNIFDDLALRHNIEAIKYLLKHGADINKGKKSYKHIIGNIDHIDHVEYIQTFKCMRMHIAKLEAAEMTVSENSLKFKDVSELLSKLPTSLAEVPELLQGLSEEGVILLNGQFVYPNAENEYREYFRRCEEEVKKLKEENKSLYDFLKADDISEQIKIWAESKQIHKQFDARENIEGLKELYPEYGSMIAYKILEIKKEIFTRNNKPLIYALSKHYGWHGLQNISYEDLLTFLKSNKNDLVKKLKGDVQKFYNIVMNIDHNTNILALPWSLEMQAAAQYVSDSKLDNPSVQQVTCSTLSK